MGWGTSQASTDYYDVFVKNTMFLWRADQAVELAKGTGWGFDIVYPRYRRMPKMTYADNFKWRGPPKKVEDEEDY